MVRGEGRETHQVGENEVDEEGKGCLVSCARFEWKICV